MFIKDLKEPYKALARQRQDSFTDSSNRGEEVELQAAFVWKETPEGRDFWDEVDSGHTPELPQSSLSVEADIEAEATLFTKENVIKVLQDRIKEAFDNGFQNYEKREVLSAIDIIQRNLPPDNFPDFGLQGRLQAPKPDLSDRYNKLNDIEPCSSISALQAKIENNLLIELKEEGIITLNHINK